MTEARLQELAAVPTLSLNDKLPVAQGDSPLRSATIQALVTFLRDYLGDIVKDGEDGRSVQLRVTATSVQWRLSGALTWLDLFDLSAIQGAPGPKGDPFVVNASGLISARGSYNTEEEGFSYLALDENKIYFRTGPAGSWSDGAPFGKGDKGDPGQDGTDGLDGDDGREVQLQKSATHIQWRLGTTGAFTNLVALADLQASVTQASVQAAITDKPAWRTAMNVAANDDARFSFVPAGTYALGQALQEKLRRISHIEDRTGSTAFAKLQNALSVHAGVGYGPLLFNDFIDATDDIFVPEGVKLQGPKDPAQLNSAEYDSIRGVIRLAAGKSIFLAPGASLDGFTIIRAGRAVPYANNAAAMADLATWSTAGTAITVAGEDVRLTNLMILGFNLGIRSNGYGRMVCDNIKGDCLNGIWVTDSYDVTRLTDCHFWPFLTAYVSPGGDQNVLFRDGICYRYSGTGDWLKATNCFGFGYGQGINSADADHISLLGCAFDNVNILAKTDTIGFFIGAGSRSVSLIGCQAAAQGSSLKVANTPDTDPYPSPVVEVIGFRSWATHRCHIDHTAGYLNVLGGTWELNSVNEFRFGDGIQGATIHIDKPSNPEFIGSALALSKVNRTPFGSPYTFYISENKRATDPNDHAAMNRCIAKVNALGGGVIEGEARDYDFTNLGSLDRIRVPVHIRGRGRLTVFKLPPNTKGFLMGDNAGAQITYSVSDLTIFYAVVGDASTIAFEQSNTAHVLYENVSVVNPVVFADVGTLESRPCGDTDLVRVTGICANVAAPLIRLRYGTGFSLISGGADGLKVDVPPPPSFTTPMDTVPGRHLIECTSGVWDTLIIGEGQLFQRWDIGLYLAPNAPGSVIYCVQLGACTWDYCNQSFVANPSNHGIISTVSLVGGYFSGLGGRAIDLFPDRASNPESTATIALVQMVSPRCFLTKHEGMRVGKGVRTLDITSPQIYWNNLANQSNTAALDIAGGVEQLSIMGGRVGSIDASLGAFTQADYGTSIGADCETIQISGLSSEGRVSGWRIADNTGPSAQRSIRGNINTGQAGPRSTGVYVTPAASTPWFNKSAHDVRVAAGGGSVAQYRMNDVVQPTGTAAFAAIIPPGGSWEWRGTAAPTVVYEILP